MEKKPCKVELNERNCSERKGVFKLGSQVKTNHTKWLYPNRFHGGFELQPLRKFLKATDTFFIPRCRAYCYTLRDISYRG